MKKALSIIMALAIVIGTFSFMASAYTYGNYITDGRKLLEPGYNLGTAPKFALGERVYGIVEENEVACYCFTPTTDKIITFKAETSDMIDITISKNGSEDKYVFSVNDVEEKKLDLEKGKIYLVTVKLANAVIDRDYGTMTADATTASAEYYFTTSYEGMPTEVKSDINTKSLELTAGQSYRLELSNISVPDLNVFWRVYDDPATLMNETDAATVTGNGNSGTVTIKMNNNSFITDTEIKVQAYWYYGTSYEITKTCTVKAIAANISLDPYYDTNSRKLYTGVGGVVDITAKTNLSDKGLIWTSEDSSIATVSPTGKITAVAVGETIVKVTIADTNITRRIQVIVLKDHNAVNGVKFDEKSVTTRVGENAKLGFEVTAVNPAIAPTNPKVTFESSNPNVVTVDPSGQITGVSLGEATITIKTADGGYKDTCKVTVKAAIPNWLMVVVAPLRIIISLIEIIFDIDIDLPI